MSYYAFRVHVLVIAIIFFKKCCWAPSASLKEKTSYLILRLCLVLVRKIFEKTILTSSDKKQEFLPQSSDCQKQLIRYFWGEKKKIGFYAQNVFLNRNKSSQCFFFFFGFKNTLTLLQEKDKQMF